MQEEPPKFKIGDHIIGNGKGNYSVTSRGWKGIVTLIDLHGRLSANGHHYYPGEEYERGKEFHGLEPRYFDLLESPADMSKVPIKFKF